MIKYIIPLLLIFCFSCQTNETEIDNEKISRQHFSIADQVTIQVYPYDHEGETKASAMPEFQPEGVLTGFSKRFEYLLMNVSRIHLPEASDRRKEIWSLFPDTAELKELYLNEYIQDEKLTTYFDETIAPFLNPNIVRDRTYTSDEVMEVASKFFYCDKVEEDTSVQAHVCIGLNGVGEAKWKEDYTFLEAFCFEGIFHDLDKDSSKVWDSFISLQEESCRLYKVDLVTLDQYLEDVKLDVFEKMKNDSILKTKLLEYYEMNKSNLAFTIAD